MRAWSSAAVGIGLGVVLGYVFGVRRGDPWVGGTIAVTSSIAVYGFLGYPQYRTRWSGSHSTFWYTLVGVLGPAMMFLTPRSTLLSDELATVVLIGSLWVGGVYAGVALAHRSSNPPDSETLAASQSSTSD